MRDALSRCTGFTHCNNPPHPDTTIWSVASYHANGSHSLSMVWAYNHASALDSHRAINRSEGIHSVEVSIIALKTGGGR